MTQTALEGYGYKVVSACSGEDALQTVSAKQARIDLLLTDVVMPGMSGPELADRVRRDYLHRRDVHEWLHIQCCAAPAY